MGEESEAVQLAVAVEAFAKRIESSTELEAYQTAKDFQAATKWFESKQCAEDRALVFHVGRYLWDCRDTKQELNRCYQCFAQVQRPDFHIQFISDLRRLINEIKNPNRLLRRELNASGSKKLM